MSRSKWKHPFVHRRIKTMSRSSQITKDFIDISFMVHDGRDFRPIIVTEDMVGHKFGEFVYTRQRYSYKKKK